MLERALGEKEALDVLLDYAADEGDSGRGDQGQRLNEAMTLHEVRIFCGHIRRYCRTPRSQF